MCRLTWAFYYKLFIIHHSLFIAEFIRHIFGTPEGTRTPGPLLRRQMLYPAELQAHIAAAWQTRGEDREI